MLRKGIAPASYSLQRLVRRSSMVRQYSSWGQAPHRAGLGSESPLENSARMRKSVPSPLSQASLAPSEWRNRVTPMWLLISKSPRWHCGRMSDGVTNRQSLRRSNSLRCCNQGSECAGNNPKCIHRGRAEFRLTRTRSATALEGANGSRLNHTS